MHSPSGGSTEHHAGGPVVGESLKLGVTLLSVSGHSAHADLVADDLEALPTLNDSPGLEVSEVLTSHNGLTSGTLPPHDRCTPSSPASSESGSPSLEPCRGSSRT